MSLFNFFQRKKPPAPQPAGSRTDAPPPGAAPGPSEWTGDAAPLRELLFEAAARGDPGALTALCREHRAAILRHLPEWKVVPEAVRNDRAAVRRYGNGLIRVAQTFEQEFGDDSLIKSFQSAPGEDDPLRRWQRKLAEARELTEALRYDEAKELLTNLLIDVRRLTSFGPTSLPGMTHGQLGACLFGKGEVAESLPHFERALGFCTEQADEEGVGAYLGASYEVHRYLGQWAAAADYADRRANHLRPADEAEAAYWSGQAARVRAGEPLNRVVASVAGRSYELDRLDGLPPDLKSTRVRFLFVRNRPSLPLSRALIEEGGRLGGEGRYYESLDAFRRAAGVDPFDPQPRYEEGTTLLHLERPAEAAESFGEADRLAPGWYNCRGDRWLAERIAVGELPQAVYLLLRLEDAPAGPDDLGQRIELADAALGRYPELAPLHLFRGKALLAAGRDAEAAESLRAGLACAPEPDVRTRLLVNLHTFAPSPDEKRQLLREAASLADTGNLMAAAMAAVALRVVG